VQGFLFSTPMPPDKVAEFMRQHVNLIEGG